MAKQQGGPGRSQEREPEGGNASGGRGGSEATGAQSGARRGEGGREGSGAQGAQGYQGSRGVAGGYQADRRIWYPPVISVTRFSVSQSWAETWSGVSGGIPVLAPVNEEWSQV